MLANLPIADLQDLSRVKRAVTSGPQSPVFGAENPAATNLSPESRLRYYLECFQDEARTILNYRRRNLAQYRDQWCSVFDGYPTVLSVSSGLAKVGDYEVL